MASGEYFQYPPPGGGSSSTTTNSISYSIGTLDGQAGSANGASISSSSIFMQSATATFPGLVSSAAQTFAGVKTFNAAPNFNSLTANVPLQLDGSKNVVSQAIDFSSIGVDVVSSISLTTQVVGILPVANGGSTGSNTGDISVTTFGTSPNNSGATIGAGQVLTLQFADATHGGAVSSTTQSFAGVKTFTSPPNFSSLSASLPLQLDGSTNVIAQAISLSGTGVVSSISLVNQVVGNLPLSQTSGSVSLTNQVVGALAQSLLAATDSTYSIGSTSNASGSRFTNAYLKNNLYLGIHPSSAGSSHCVLSTNLAIGPNPGLLMYAGSGIGFQLGTDGVELFIADTGGAQKLFKVAQKYFHHIDYTTGVNYVVGSATCFTLNKVPLLINGSTSGGVSVYVPAVTSSYPLILPASQGSASWVMQNDGAGNLTWASVLTNPMTTSGDIIVGSGSGTTSRVAIGSDSKVLTANSGSSQGLKWAYTDSNVMSISAAYTTSGGEGVFLCTGSAYSVSLTSGLTAVGQTKKFINANTGNLFGIITIATNGSQTIGTGGGTQTTLNSDGECLELFCDGSASWQIIQRRIPSTWFSYTPTFTAFGTVTSVSFFAQRVGDSLSVHGTAFTGTVTAAEARASLPANLTSSDSTKIPFLMTVGKGNEGTVSVTDFGSFAVTIERSVTYVTFIAESSSATFAKANANAMTGNTVNFGFFATGIPINGWNG